MAQLFFKYGAMNSGKSIEILKVAHNYEGQNKNVLIFTSALDDRYQLGFVSSRIGLQREAILIDSNTDIYKVVSESPVPLSCVLIDEVQFASKEHVL